MKQEHRGREAQESPGLSRGEEVKRRKNREAPEEYWDHFFSTDPVLAEQGMEEVVTHYQYLVEAIARKLEYNLPSYIADEDLISYAQLGLMRALKRYQRERGKFSKYASSVIWGAVVDGLRAQDFAPRGLRRQQRDVEAATEDLQNRGNLNPTDEEVAEELGIETSEVRTIHHKVERSYVSPMDPIYIPEGSLHDDPTAVIMGRGLAEFLSRLPKVERQVIALRYYYELPSSKISDRLGIAPDNVRDINRRVLLDLLQWAKEELTAEE